MSGRMISELNSAATLQSSDLFPLARGATTLKMSGSTLAAGISSIVQSSLIAGGVATKSDVDSLSATVEAGATKYAATVPSNRGGAGSTYGILKADGIGNVEAALANIDYVFPSTLNDYALNTKVDNLSSSINTKVDGLSAFADINFATNARVDGLSSFADNKFATNTKVDGLSSFADINFATNTKVDGLSSFADVKFASNTRVDGLSSFADINFATNTKVDGLSSFANVKFIPKPASATNGQVLNYNSSSGNWEPATVASINTTVYAPLSGATFTGAVSGNTATFTVSVSAPTISGRFVGDGSALTGVATAGNYLSASGGNITGSLNVSNNFGVGTVTPSSKMHVIGDSRLQGNVTITGNLSCTGTQTFSNTVFTTTSAVSVVNTGPGVGLYVGNSGIGDIASFYDIDQNIEVLHIGGNNGTFPNVGVKTSAPNKTLTVNGEISATEDIWTSGKFRGDGSLLTGIVTNTSAYAPLSGATFTGAVTGTTATFTTSISAPTVRGRFVGDGSGLTGLTMSSYAPLSGATFTGAVTGTTATFTTSISAPIVSGRFVGDGSGLTGVSPVAYAPLSGATFTGAVTGTTATFTTSISAPAVRGRFIGDGSGLTGITTVVGYVPLSGGSMSGRLDLSTTTETKAAPTVSLSAVSLDLSTATFFYVNLNSNTTFTFANTPASPRVFSFMLQLVGDGTLRTITWPAAVRWGGGLAPIPTSTLNKIDTYSFLTHDGGTNWFGFIVEQNS